MKTRAELAEELGMSDYYMNSQLTKAGIQVRLGSCYTFIWPYAQEEFEKEVRWVDPETGSLIRKTFITETGEELIKEVLDVLQNNGIDNNSAGFIRNRWGRRIYEWKRRPYTSNRAFYDSAPGVSNCKA